MGEVLSHLLKTRFPEVSANKVYWVRSNNRSSHLAILILIIVNIYNYNHNNSGCRIKNNNAALLNFSVPITAYI